MTPLSQEVGGTDNGVYHVQLAMLEFDDIPSDSGHDSSDTTGTVTSSGTPAATSTQSMKPPNNPVSSILSIVEHGGAAHALRLGVLHVYAIYIVAMHVLLFTRVRGRII